MEMLVDEYAVIWYVSKRGSHPQRHEAMMSLDEARTLKNDKSVSIIVTSPELPPK